MIEYQEVDGVIMIWILEGEVEVKILIHMSMDVIIAHAWKPKTHQDTSQEDDWISRVDGVNIVICE